MISDYNLMGDVEEYFQTGEIECVERVRGLAEFVKNFTVTCCFWEESEGHLGFTLDLLVGE
jgi:hypothetical protein